MTHDMPGRVARLRAYIDEGRIIRYEWMGRDQQGRLVACLLAALVPECGEMAMADVCPAEVMPSWMAHLTPDIDDYVSHDAWPGTIRRYADCAAGWHALDGDAWDRAQAACLVGCLEIARESVTVDQWGVLPAIDEVLRLLREGGPESAWAVARAAVTTAWTAARTSWVTAQTAAEVAAAEVAVTAAWAAAEAAARTARTVAETAVRTAEVADKVASRTAEVADKVASRTAAWVARTDARTAAWDRIADLVLAILEAEICTARGATTP